MGRWLSRDPIAERGGINLYDYVLNNPIFNIDPLGSDNLNLFSPTASPAQFAGANANGTQPGIYSVTGHGSSSDIMGLTPKQVADKILADTANYKPGEPVILHSCETGGDNGGKPNFAQQLAKLLHATVTAPTTKIDAITNDATNAGEMPAQR